jgi:hypothetical protein
MCRPCRAGRSRPSTWPAVRCERPRVRPGRDPGRPAALPPLPRPRSPRPEQDQGGLPRHLVGHDRRSARGAGLRGAGPGPRARPGRAAVRRVPPAGHAARRAAGRCVVTATYQEFLQSKAQLATATGLEVDPAEVHPVLKGHQRDMVCWAVRGGRRAIFASFGLGKTLVQLEILRLILAKLGGRDLPDQLRERPGRPARPARLPGRQPGRGRDPPRLRRHQDLP